MTQEPSTHIQKPSNGYEQTNAYLIGILGSIVILATIGLLAPTQGMPKTMELKVYASLIGLFITWLFVARIIGMYPRTSSGIPITEQTPGNQTIDITESIPPSGHLVRCRSRWSEVGLIRILSRPTPLFWIFCGVLLPIIVLLNAIATERGFLTIFFAVTTTAGCILWGIECRSVPNTQRTGNAWITLNIGVFVTMLLTFMLSTGTTFHIFSWPTIMIFGGSWIVLSKGRLPLSDTVFSISVALLLAPLFFLVRIGFMDLEHYAYILGPVIEAAYGHYPLADIAPQYGAGMTMTLAMGFRLWGGISNGGLIVLLRILTYGQFLLVFFISWSLTRSRALALCTLFSALVFAYFSQGNNYYAFPSTGFLRFGFPLIITGIYCISDEKFIVRLRPFLIAIITAIASFWSFESLVYTVPAVIAAEWMGGEVQNGEPKETRDESRKMVGRERWKFLALLLLCLIGVWGAYFLFLIGSGHSPDIAQFVEYSLLFANGYGQIPLERLTSVWWIFPPIALFGLTEIIIGERRDKRVILLSVYALALFTYFGGRAFPNNLQHVSLPFILLTFTFLSRISRRSLQLFTAATAVTLFTAVNLSFMSLDPALLAMTKLMQSSMEEIRGNLPKPVYDDCSLFEEFRTYVYNGQLALIDASLVSYNIFQCVGARNAFGIDPFDETEISPRAVERATAKARTLPRQTVLVSTKETTDRPLATALLKNLILKKIGRKSIGGELYDVYDGRGNGWNEQN